MTPGLASVIIVNWNGRELLERNLPAVESQQYRPFEVIVVDNGSHDGSVDYLRKAHPEIHVLPLAENTGFAGGNNRGLALARGEFIVALNNDARPEPGWLEALVRNARSYPQTGIFASLLVANPSGRVDSAGDGYGSTLSPVKHGAGDPPDRHRLSRPVFSACGGAALYRRSLIDSVGFFDERFFMCYEDVDLSFRARLAGWDVRFVAA
jgi:GT2 family glycosyltransferase